MVRHVMLLFGVMSDKVRGLLQGGSISGRNAAPIHMRSFLFAVHQGVVHALVRLAPRMEQQLDQPLILHFFPPYFPQFRPPT